MDIIEVILCHVSILGLLVVGSAATTYSQGSATAFNGPGGQTSDGGACGYTNLVYRSGYKGRGTAVSEDLFKHGLGCGECFKVRCFIPSICSTNSTTVIVMDRAPPGDDRGPYFDISGSAFDRMALEGQSQNLRNQGRIAIAWKWTKCKYRGKNIAFFVMGGSTVSWFSLLVEFEGGDGDIQSMKIKGVSGDWKDMAQVWGASWCTNIENLQGPLSIQLTSSSRKTKEIINVIPVDWEPLKTYNSNDNF